MAHFALLNENNIVVDVDIVSNEVINNLPFPESEPVGIVFLTQWAGSEKNWKQTSYNANFRKHYAGIGFSYDSRLDAFIPPSPYPSWVLDENMCIWISPVPYPNDGKYYVWDETTVSWKEI
jgi:hypothetical protein